MKKKDNPSFDLVYGISTIAGYVISNPPYIYIYICVCVCVCVCEIYHGLVLCHINIYRLFYAKSSLYVYIKYISFNLVWFNGISTIVGYFMPNPFYRYILNIYHLVWFGFMAY